MSFRKVPSPEHSELGCKKSFLLRHGALHLLSKEHSKELCVSSMTITQLSAFQKTVCKNFIMAVHNFIASTGEAETGKISGFKASLVDAVMCRAAKAT